MVRATAYRRLQGPRRCDLLPCRPRAPPAVAPAMATHARPRSDEAADAQTHARVLLPAHARALARTRTRTRAHTHTPACTHAPERPSPRRPRTHVDGLAGAGGVGIAGNGPVDARLHADCVEAFIASRMHKCHGCRQPIRGGQVIASSSRSWHEECFLCAACRRPLQLDFVELQGEPYHAACVRPVGRA